MNRRYVVLLLGGCALAVIGIALWNTKFQIQQPPSSASNENKGSMSSRNITPCAIALAPHKGDEEIDRVKRYINE